MREVPINTREIPMFICVGCFVPLCPGVFVVKSNASDCWNSW